MSEQEEYQRQEAAFAGSPCEDEWDDVQLCWTIHGRNDAQCRKVYMDKLNDCVRRHRKAFNEGIGFDPDFEAANKKK